MPLIWLSELIRFFASKRGIHPPNIGSPPAGKSIFCAGTLQRCAPLLDESRAAGLHWWACCDIASRRHRRAVPSPSQPRRRMKKISLYDMVFTARGQFFPLDASHISCHHLVDFPSQSDFPWYYASKKWNRLKNWQFLQCTSLRRVIIMPSVKSCWRGSCRLFPCACWMMSWILLLDTVHFQTTIWEAST